MGRGASQFAGGARVGTLLLTVGEDGRKLELRRFGAATRGNVQRSV